MSGRRETTFYQPARVIAAEVYQIRLPAAYHPAPFRKVHLCLEELFGEIIVGFLRILVRGITCGFQPEDSDNFFLIRPDSVRTRLEHNISIFKRACRRICRYT